jgi:hypothetical protein
MDKKLLASLEYLPSTKRVGELKEEAFNGKIRWEKSK